MIKINYLGVVLCLVIKCLAQDNASPIHKISVKDVWCSALNKAENTNSLRLVENYLFHLGKLQNFRLNVNKNELIGQDKIKAEELDEQLYNDVSILFNELKDDELALELMIFFESLEKEVASSALADKVLLIDQCLQSAQVIYRKKWLRELIGMQRKLILRQHKKNIFRKFDRDWREPRRFSFQLRNTE